MVGTWASPLLEDPSLIVATTKCRIKIVIKYFSDGIFPLLNVIHIVDDLQDVARINQTFEAKCGIACGTGVQMPDSMKKVAQLFRPHLDSFDYLLDGGLDRAVTSLRPKLIEKDGLEMRDIAPVSSSPNPPASLFEFDEFFFVLISFTLCTLA